MSAIETIKNGDGTYTVKYFGKDAGYFAKAKSPVFIGVRYRWISVHGTIGYAYSKAQARKDIMGAYH